MAEVLVKGPSDDLRHRNPLQRRHAIDPLPLLLGQIDLGSRRRHTSTVYSRWRQIHHLRSAVRGRSEELRVRPASCGGWTCDAARPKIAIRCRRSTQRSAADRTRLMRSSCASSVSRSMPFVRSSAATSSEARRVNSTALAVSIRPSRLPKGWSVTAKPHLRPDGPMRSTVSTRSAPRSRRSDPLNGDRETKRRSRPRPLPAGRTRGRGAFVPAGVGAAGPVHLPR